MRVRDPDLGSLLLTLCGEGPAASLILAPFSLGTPGRRAEDEGLNALTWEVTRRTTPTRSRVGLI
jgi:hypothetical protein